jgi:hypothetical protein
MFSHQVGCRYPAGTRILLRVLALRVCYPAPHLDRGFLHLRLFLRRAGDPASDCASLDQVRDVVVTIVTPDVRSHLLEWCISQVQVRSEASIKRDTGGMVQS